MVSGQGPGGWWVFGQSVRGAAHIRSQRPNQDAIAWCTGPRCGLPIMLAVSDGHGSARSFRSDTGAALAVDATLSAFTRFLNFLPRRLEGDALRGEAEGFLPRELEYQWKRRVLDHLTLHPFTGKETETLYLHRREADGEPDLVNPFLAYGATALGVLLTDQFLIHLQLGDGDLLNVSSQGGVRRPLPHDDRLLGNETTSLCVAHASRDVRVAVTDTAEGLPAVILASTDGYANSFRDDDAFLRVGPDLLEILRTDGPQNVNDHLRGWLEEASREGSGDDITLGILCRADLHAATPATGETASCSDPITAT